MRGVWFAGLVALGHLAGCSGSDDAAAPKADAATDAGLDSTAADAGSDGAGGSSADSALPDAAAEAGAPIVLLPRTSILAEELGVLVNKSDPQSVAVAAEYVKARGIPAANVVELDFAPVANLPAASFATLKEQVDAAMSPSVQGLAVTWTQPYRVDCMSVTSAFALGFDKKYCNQTGGSCGPTATVATFNSESVAPYTDHGVRPTIMLAGSNTQAVSDLIKRGVAADDTFPSGDGYLVRTTDTARSVRWPTFQPTIGDWDHPGGLTLNYVDNSDGSGSNSIDNKTNLLFYFTGLAKVPNIDTNSYRPGAIADHLTSVGGQVPTSGQMSVVAWLEAGVTGSYGTVVEPCNYTEKFPNVRVLLPHYFRGETLLEAYWKSVARPGEGLFVGEPLARPWGATTVDFDGTTLTLRTTWLLPGVQYAVESAPAESGPFTPVQSVQINAYERADIVVPNATAAVYRLVKQ
ncbi:MAG: TIGR03790 family protein [Polyangiaceae bacterium]